MGTADLGANVTETAFWDILQNGAQDLSPRFCLIALNRADEVSGRLAATSRAGNLKGRNGRRQTSDALLAGKLFDDRSNAMSPNHAAKSGRRWRYYVSQALLQGRKQDAGSIARAPAAEIEKQVRQATNPCPFDSSVKRWDSLRIRRSRHRPPRRDRARHDQPYDDHDPAA